MSASAQFSAPSGIGSFTSESYLERLQGGRGPRSLPTSHRLEVGPAGAVPTVSVAPTTSARPKPSNAAIPYARTSPTQLDAGTIVMVNTYVDGLKLGLEKPPRSIVGPGTASLATVKSMAQLNALLEPLTKEDSGADWEHFLQSWRPDGIVINYDSSTGSAHETWPIVNVAVAGPTPMLNEGGPERAPPVAGEDVHKHMCWLPGEGSPSRLYVALATYEVSDKTKAKYIAFSTSTLLPSGNWFNGYKFVAAWKIGRILDSKLNMKFRNTGQVLVDIGPMMQPIDTDTRVSTHADGRNGAIDVRIYKGKNLLKSLVDGVHPEEELK